MTGERAVVRVGTEETGGELLIVDLFVRPGGAVLGEHLHPVIEERFTVLSGRVDFSINGRHEVAGPGRQLVVPPHTAHVRVEVRPAARFEEMVKNSFGLARDGKTNAKGMPNPLQLALFAREFDDVMRLTKPPRAIQKLLFAVLAPVAKLLGYRGSYPEYYTPLEAGVPLAPRPNTETISLEKVS